MRVTGAMFAHITEALEMLMARQRSLALEVAELRQQGERRMNTDDIPSPAEVRARMYSTHTEEATAIIRAIAKELRETRHVVGRVWVPGVPGVPSSTVVHEVTRRMRIAGWDVQVMQMHSGNSREDPSTCWSYEPALQEEVDAERMRSDRSK